VVQRVVNATECFNLQCDTAATCKDHLQSKEGAHRKGPTARETGVIVVFSVKSDSLPIAALSRQPLPLSTSDLSACSYHSAARHQQADPRAPFPAQLSTVRHA
jgi:hypothetical protein